MFKHFFLLLFVRRIVPWILLGIMRHRNVIIIIVVVVVVVVVILLIVVVVLLLLLVELCLPQRKLF